jgi:hypothetical protein
MWKLLEVGLDGIYCPLLLLNKKKYAALSVTERDGVITKVYTCCPAVQLKRAMFCSSLLVV